MWSIARKAGWGSENTSGASGSEHTVHLAEDTVEVGDGAQRVDADGGVDRVGPHEREVGEVALVQLDLHVLPLGEPAGVVTCSADSSTAMTRAPCFAMATVIGPPPQPSSSTRLPSRGPSRRRSASVGMSGP